MRADCFRPSRVALEHAALRWIRPEEIPQYDFCPADAPILERLRELDGARAGSLREMQKAAYQNKLDKGFNVTDVHKEFCLLYGEVAEAYDAYRKKQHSVGEELADVAIYLMGLAEILGVDLQAEVQRKMAINRARVYENKNGVLLKAQKK